MVLAQLVGPSSAGKTTLINYIKKNRLKYEKQINKSILIQDDNSRILFDKYYAKDYSSFEALINDPERNFKFQYLIGDTSYNTQIKYLHDDKTLMISDGGSLGNSVYLKIAFNQLKQKGVRKRYEKDYNRLLKKEHSLENKSLLYYVEMPVKSSMVENDGFRPATLMNVRSSELELFLPMKFYSTVLPKDLQKRFEFIDNEFSKNSKGGL